MWMTAILTLTTAPMAWWLRVGPRYYAMLLGFTVPSHQVGGFFGARPSGIAVARTGNYDWMGWADALLTPATAFVNLSIKEEKPKLRLATT